ncbi:putative peptidase YqjE [Candidatus Syntrophocurvum alkaliphilum]|uniref:Putative peptidase YqjE n=1 Tax=Candidatus Syntrophocurvum alkaliphilum TaxID=2293317 RepID=A0A6I6DER6_9FIRM|nr:M20/M25/M40 family metallo-hydrolase [Candidatus Syntrophocurvum alkaliphilum]QGT98981.1 putative peptidase YqjE [Candidatus Syntrophocurvum alkaliphilum]
MLNKDRLIKTFLDLVQIDSVSGNEAQVKEYIKNIFEKLDAQVIEDNAGELTGGNCGNLLIRIPGNLDLSPLLFCAHMDTVEPGNGIKAVIENEVIKSKGETILGSDDKAAIAALIEAVYTLKENNVKHPPLEYLLTVSEEQGLLGVKVFDFSNIKAKIGYTLDAAGRPGTIIVQSPCQNEIEYTVYGKTAHAGIAPEEGINAIKLASMALAKMPSGRIDDETTTNLGIIEGGRARNIVADHCKIKGEARSLNKKKLDEITNTLEKTFKDEVTKYGGKAEVDVKYLYSPVSLDKDETVVKLAIKAFQQIGIDYKLESTGGGSDASIINGNNIRCANLGIGMNAVHTTDEYITIEDLIKDAQMTISIIKESVNYL